MKKKRPVLSVPGRQAVKNAGPMPDSKLDFSDIPESTDEELKKAKRVGRPKTGYAKQLIAIRVHPKLLTALRQLASHRSKPYQTFIHEILEKAVKRAA